MIPWNKLVGWILFPVWVNLNSAAFSAGVVWLIGWWFIFYCIVELYVWRMDK